MSNPSDIHILVVDRHIPFFDRDAGSYRMFNVLKVLADLGYRVTFIGDNFEHIEPYDTIHEQSGIEILYPPRIGSFQKYLSQSGQMFDIVMLSRPNIAKKHLKNIRKYCRNANIVFDTVDLRSLRMSRLAALKQDQRLSINAYLSKQTELSVAKACDATLVVSENEKNLLLDEIPSLNIHVVSGIFDISLPEKGFSHRENLMFLGSFSHLPNADGVGWFLKEIFPKIKEAIPGIKIFIVGDNSIQDIQALSSDDVIFTGYVQDLCKLFNQCRVFVAPLRCGAGIKGKIYHSMSYGLPVVTTTIGAEGMGVIDGWNVLIADDPALFSKKVIQLYQQEELWNTLSRNSLEYIHNNHSFEKSKGHIRSVIGSILMQ